VVTVRPDTPYWEIAAMFRKHRVSGFPVTAGDGTVVGVVSESDLLALAAGRHHRGHRAAGQATAGDLMTHPAVTVSPDDLVHKAARVMQSRRLQRLPVTGRDGRLEGIVSRSDVLSVFRRSDEDIRREITQDVIADGFFTDPARFTVTVHNGIVTLEGEPGSAVLGAGIAGQVEHLEGVIAVRDRFVYPARSAPSFPSDPGL
jgi:CBS-domain-containing membrane protein